MKITWLGQAGLLFETNGRKIIIDPYLSDSVEKVNPKNYRRVGVDPKFLKIIPDVLILTHNHLDHTDPETLKHYLSNDGCITVLASENAWNEVRKFGGGHNYVSFNRGTVWTKDGIRFEAVRAEHSDNAAIGVIVFAEGKSYYITGDTLYNKDVIANIPNGIDIIFLPVNGVGNNMNMRDAAAFAEAVGAKIAVPLHFGMFDDLNPSGFRFKNHVIPEIYKEIKFTGE